MDYAFAAVILLLVVSNSLGSEIEDGGLANQVELKKELDDMFHQSQWPIPVDQFELRAKRFPAHLLNDELTRWMRVGECPQKSEDGVQLFYCPSLTPDGEHACIDDHQLCDGYKNCPGSEDENRNYCFFYKALKAKVANVEKSMGTLGQMLHNQQSLAMRSRKYGKKYTNY